MALGRYAGTLLPIAPGITATASIILVAAMHAFNVRIGQRFQITTTAFREAMQASGLSTEGIIFEVEPGRALHNETGIHLTRVHVVKHETANIDRRWLETDTSEVFLRVGRLNCQTREAASPLRKIVRF